LDVVNSLSYSFDFGFLGSGSATLQQAKVRMDPSFHGSPGPPATVSASGDYNQTQNHVAADGDFDYTTTAQGSGSADLEDSPRATGNFTGTVTHTASLISLSTSLNLLFDIEQDGTDIGDLHVTGTVRATAPLLELGDSDGDGDVDLNDLGNLATAYGASSNATWGMGDFDSDGDVDLNDLGTLATHYGTGQAQAYADFQALTSVPEPMGAGILVIALAALGRRRRRIST
jgi:MYXO-CTERM domain-containing protein